jgi:uncharacterized protein (TIGR03435 family)
MYDNDEPDVIAAAPKLDLKLERSKGPIDLIVVTHVERPSEN